MRKLALSFRRRSSEGGPGRRAHGDSLGGQGTGPPLPCFMNLLGGSWGLVSTVLGTLTGVITSFISVVTLFITVSTKSHEPLSRVPFRGFDHRDPWGLYFLKLALLSPYYRS